MVVQSRVLEFYRQYGFDDKIVEAGIPIQHFNVYKDKRPVGKLPIAKKGKGVSPYPYVLTLPQDIHEQILVEELEKSVDKYVGNMNLYHLMTTRHL